ncbi:MAG: hypothetical protein ACR2MS_12375 [Weeksellaceae bacterium]
MKYIILFLIAFCFFSCGTTEEKEYVYTVVLTNETGEILEIASDGEKTILNNNESYTNKFASGLRRPTWPGGSLQIKIGDTNRGYQCGFIMEHTQQSFCFIPFEEFNNLSKSNVFMEIEPYVYELVMRPEFLDGAYDLPEIEGL